MASTTGSPRPPGKPAAKTGAKPSGKPAGKKGGSRGRTPVAPVKSGPPWGLIGIGVAITVFAAVVIGYAVTQINDAKKPAAQRISGVVDYRKTEKLARNHVTTNVKYAQSPPVGGNHNSVWQNCMGDVYGAQIANENAVHSLEHGAAWITYNPSLAPSQVAALASTVRGKPYLMMSPYPGLKKPISLQAWGYQLFVDKASDKRIGEFIAAYSQKASVEPGATCSGGTLKTGTNLKNTPG